MRPVKLVKVNIDHSNLTGRNISSHIFKWSKRKLKSFLKREGMGIGGEWGVGSWQLAVGSWQLAVGGWQLAVGSWQLAVGSWQLAVGGGQLAVGSGVWGVLSAECWVGSAGWGVLGEER